MTKQEQEVLKYFDGCRFPARQVKIVAELTALEIKDVLRILRNYRRIPQSVTVRNYKEILKNPVVQPIKKDLEHFLKYGPTAASTIEREIKIPKRITNALRKDAWRKEDGDE